MNSHDEMSDNDVLRAVGDSLWEVPMAKPPQVQDIMAWGRATRRRRRVPAVAASLAVVAGAAVALTVLLPASHPASHQPGLQLTAWTVVKEPGGTIKVTIRELHNPAGLQHKLRADGVPASVTFYSGYPYPSSCRAYPASQALINKVFPGPGVSIRPSALPTGTGVDLIGDFSNPHGGIGVEVGLVHASQRCTGS